MHRVLGLLLLPGCELVFPLVEAVGPIEPRICDPGTPFPAGKRVGLDTNDSVEAARFVPDRSVVYVSLCSDPATKSTCDLYQGTYNKMLDQYGVFAELSTINDDNEYDAYPTITPDTDFIVYASEREQRVHIFVAESVNGQFQNPRPLTVAATQYSNEPYLLGDGQTLYVSGGTDAGKSDLFRAVGTPPDFNAFELVSGVNTNLEEFAPVVTDDELEIFFASNRNNAAETLALDIFTSTRASTSDPFDVATEIGTISQSTTTDWPLWISPDRCELYYINKQGDQATLYVSHR